MENSTGMFKIWRNPRANYMIG